jgi:hypothetical protein
VWLGSELAAAGGSLEIGNGAKIGAVYGGQLHERAPFLEHKRSARLASCLDVAPALARQRFLQLPAVAAQVQARGLVSRSSTAPTARV